MGRALELSVIIPHHLLWVKSLNHSSGIWDRNIGLLFLEWYPHLTCKSLCIFNLLLLVGDFFQCKQAVASKIRDQVVSKCCSWVRTSILWMRYRRRKGDLNSSVTLIWNLDSAAQSWRKWEFSFYFYFLRVFIIKGCQHFSNAFLCIYWANYVIYILYSADMEYHINIVILGKKRQIL